MTAGQWEMDTLAEINKQRAQYGLEPVLWDWLMQQFADDQSRQMAERNYLFHSNRFALQGGECCEQCPHWTPPWKIVETWMSSPPHRGWLLHPETRHGAIGIGNNQWWSYVAFSFSR